MPDPPVGLGALRRLVEEALEVFPGADGVAPLQQEEGEAVVRAGEARLEIQRAPIATDGLVEPSGLRERDRHVLEHLGIVGLVAQREAIRRQRGVVVALPLERERLAQIIQALRLELTLRLAAHEAAPPGHESRNQFKEGHVARGWRPMCAMSARGAARGIVAKLGTGTY